jgi:hypothetical protein
MLTPGMSDEALEAAAGRETKWTTGDFPAATVLNPGTCC